MSAATIELLSPRLRLRPWRDDDEAPMAAINSDPAVIEFLNQSARGAKAAPAAFLERVEAHWKEHGFGHWAVEARSEPLAGRTIGFVGVAYPTFLPELAARPELGWRLARQAWGKGYATEAAFLARDDAFTRLDLPELISIIHPDNERSRRVATKVGMSIEHQVWNPTLKRNVDVWQMAAPDPDPDRVRT